MSRNDPPAFPVPEVLAGNQHIAARATGITLRQYIATQLLAGMLADSAILGNKKLKNVQDALEFADILIHESSK